MVVELDEPIEVVAYDPSWPAWYAQDAEQLRGTLAEPLLELAHFGSTSVPGLVAKPVIDILVALPSWPLAADARARLEALGYEYLGEAGVPGREYLRRRAQHSTNLAVVRKPSPLWDDNLAVRDYLIAHPNIATKYGESKRAVWARGARTLLEYSRAKHAFVSELVANARNWRSSR